MAHSSQLIAHSLFLIFPILAPMKKILVANRGEIALRVMRSAREMGIQTVAVYSEADRTMPFVQYADEAVCIGPAPSNQSYLLGEKIIATALQTGADAIHPGYGFLSENAVFARQVTAAGLIFIGPDAASIEVMGSKLAAKQAAQQFGVPMVPGTETPLRSVEEAREVVKKTGFPILIKASAGGGGKGMRIVNQESELEEQIGMAKREAMSAFGDDAVFIEKYVTAPRHIEIQILGDQHGNYVYLFERECSIQRRHQKLIEEAPSSVLTPDIRQAMGKCALDVARACNYYGAGTVEFLVDEQLNFYFLEMNTRLQVEHPVTEMITGLDLVKEQIKIARGEALSFTQDSLKINGHAIELRICAEDPANNFLPDTGKLETYIRPQGYGVRVDDGYEQGMDIPIYYDPMIAKLIAWGNNREEARERLLRAIAEYQVKGIRTTLPFGYWALQQPAFIEGKFDTNFIAKYFTPQVLQHHREDLEQLAAILATQIWQTSVKATQQTQLNGNSTTATSNWQKRKMLR
jgi:acetyl-CoA carboxylase biotin carboxylase subunit